MTQQKKTFKNKQIKAQLSKELNFLKGLFSVMHLPSQSKNEEENIDYEMVADSSKNSPEKSMPKRARSIAELEEKLEKLKCQNNFNLKNKLVKKSLSSKLNKKIKKKERLNKAKPKPFITKSNIEQNEVDDKPKITNSKPVFNNEGKLVFSKFDFANIGNKGKEHKTEKDPKKILESLRQQQEKINKLEEKEDSAKVKEIKEKIAWKTIMQKAEGQKVKDDPLLLKKSIKKMEQKKKLSKKQWDNRIENVEQKKEDRQKKRKENIMKKKKEKKSKIVKAAVKRGRVVI